MNEPGTAVMVPQTDAAALLQVIERAAADPAVDMDKMERLLGMHERILSRNAEAEFAAAMTRVQSRIPMVVRDADNDQTRSKYARHETIAAAIKPIYTAEGFSITFSEGTAPREDCIRVEAILRHQAGHKETHHLDVPLDIAGLKGTANKTPTHASGSTYSYGRRYLTCMLFDVTTGDDNDGNGEEGVLADKPELAAKVLAQVKKLYPDNPEAVLESLAQRRFKIANGDWSQIPLNRVAYAVNAIEEKFRKETTTQE